MTSLKRGQVAKARLGLPGPPDDRRRRVHRARGAGGRLAQPFTETWSILGQLRPRPTRMIVLENAARGCRLRYGGRAPSFAPRSPLARRAPGADHQNDGKPEGQERRIPFGGDGQTRQCQYADTDPHGEGGRERHVVDEQRRALAWRRPASPSVPSYGSGEPTAAAADRRAGRTESSAVSPNPAARAPTPTGAGLKAITDSPPDVHQRMNWMSASARLVAEPVPGAARRR